MRSFRPVLWCLVISTLPLPAAATRVYQSKAADGSTVFSDQPSPGAQAIDIDLPPASDSPPPPAKPAAGTTPPRTAAEAAPYATLQITEPTNDSVHWFAQGPVQVRVRIVPPLAEGHVLVPLLNGEPQGTGVTSSEFALTDLNPDTYELAVVVRDAQDHDLQQSPAVRFHVKHQSLNLPARKPPPRGG